MYVGVQGDPPIPQGQETFLCIKVSLKFKPVLAGYFIFLFLPFPMLLPLPMLGGPAGHLCHPRHHPGHPPLELCGEHPEEDGQKEHTYKPLGKAKNIPG